MKPALAAAAPPPAAAAAAPALVGPAAAPAAPPAQQAEADASSDRPGKCQFWMEKKRRHCKFDAAPGKRYCGNHLFFAEGEGPKRVPCPWDPKGGHTVLESELEKHKHKCPGYRHWLQERSQPFFSEDINAGPPESDVAWPAGLQPLQPPAQPAAAAAAEGGGEGAAAAAAAAGGDRKRRRRQRGPQGGAAMAAAYAASLGPQRFEALLQRIEAACEQVCEAEPLRLEVPPEAEPFLQPESATCNRPFSLKHAQQQASIVGNMKAAGLLGDAAATTYIEYGAGKGYLSHMLMCCTPAVRKVVVMDVRGFKEKADRSMRHLELQRLRCDIKDFHVAQVAGLEGGAAPWVAFGKHLCGAATDFTLRSCARERARQAGAPAAQHAQQAAAAAAAAAAPADSGSGPAAVTPAAAEAAGPVPAAGGVRGLAVATCCHHRCSWRHFVAQDIMRELGFSPQEFEVIAWMTGWALCGHEAPAGYGGSEEEEEEQGGGGKGAAQAAGGHKRGREDDEEVQQQGQQAQQGQHAAQPAAPAGAAADGSAGQQQVQAQPAAAEAAAADEEWRPQWALPRDRKIQVGQRCKRLIDAARLAWLRRQGFAAGLVKYVASSVSGENRLLVATAQQQQAQQAKQQR